MAVLHSMIDPIQLSPTSVFDSPSASCTCQDGIRATVSADILPHSDLPWTIALTVLNISGDGHLFQVGPLSVVREGYQVRFALAGQVPQSFPFSPSHRRAYLVISYHGQRKHLLCVNGAEILWSFDVPQAPSHISLAKGIILGDPRGVSTIPAVFESLQVSPVALSNCSNSVTAVGRSESAPAILFPGMTESSDLFVNEILPVNSTVQCESRPCKLRVTVFGVYSSTCNQPECGDLYAVWSIFAQCRA